MGICGSITGIEADVPFRTTLTEYYKNLNIKESAKDKYFKKIQPSSDKFYSGYCLTKTAKINPVWSKLFFGSYNAWEYLWNVEYKMMK